jgi:uncharacterized protein YdeI (YjbR/CyaY-like superfamily)
VEPLEAASGAEWRAWLARHSATEAEVWLVIPHRRSGVPGPGYDEAIEQALCFGWIDSHARRHGEHAMRLRFSPRRPRSNWSDRNRVRAARMVEQGLMTPAGRAALDRAG